MWFGKVAAWLLGGGVATITESIREIRKDALDAKNTSERIALEDKVAVLENRRAVLVAEAKGNWNVVFRAFLAVPFAVFVWKVIVYDKVMGLGSTDDLSPDLWNLMMVVYGFYFVYETAALFRRN
jgi:hypothetical protein